MDNFFPLPTQRIIKFLDRVETKVFQLNSHLLLVRKEPGIERGLVSLKGIYFYLGIVISLPSSIHFRQ